MVQSRIKAKAATFHSWQHWCQTQQWSWSVFLWGPQGVAEWGWPTPYLASNGECPEQLHSWTPPTSRGNSSWTTTTRFVDYCWIFPALFLPGWSKTMLAAWFLLSYLTTLATVCAPPKRHAFAETTSVTVPHFCYKQSSKCSSGRSDGEVAQHFR